MVGAQRKVRFLAARQCPELALSVRSLRLELAVRTPSASERNACQTDVSWTVLHPRREHGTPGSAKLSILLAPDWAWNVSDIGHALTKVIACKRHGLADAGRILSDQREVDLRDVSVLNDVMISF